MNKSALVGPTPDGYATQVNVGADGIVEIRAYGETRAQRGAKLSAAVRRLRAEGRVLERFHISYDEMYGFMSMTWGRYRTKPTP